MQAPSRGLTLDQLRAPINATGVVNGAGETAQEQSSLALTHTELAHNPLALLEDMLRALAPTESRDIIARRLAALAKQATGIDLCVVMLIDQNEAFRDGTGGKGGRCLSIRASSPDVNEHILTVPPLKIEAGLWEKLSQPALPGQLPALDVREQDVLNPLDNVAYGALFIVPLVAGAECVGMLYGYTSSVRDLARQELLILQTICGYAAMSIASRTLLDFAHTGAPVQAFFDNLLADIPPQEDALRRQAAALGYNVTRPSAMVMLEIIETPDAHEQPDELDPSDVPGSQDAQQKDSERQARFSRLLSYVHAHVQEQYPRLLVNERGQHLYCIIALEDDDDAVRLDSWLATMARQIEGDYDAQLCAGISHACTDVRDYPRGFAEAREALQIGECLHRHAASTRFGALSPYRYLYPFAREQRLSDRYLDHVATIASYDRKHKRGNLLLSLETYLALGGNIKDASEQLKVHRNTLTQRLERIQTLCGVDLDAHDESFALQLAIMVYQLRA